MITLWLWIFIFLNAIFYLVIFDVILSWLTILWINYRPNFLSQIIDPIYKFINKIIPTTFWMFRFDALIVILLIYVIQTLLINIIPGLNTEILRLTNSF